MPRVKVADTFLGGAARRWFLRHWLGFPAFDRARECHGFGERRHPQLSVKDPFAFVKLPDRRDPIARPRMDPHERAVCRLVQWIELEPSLRVVDRTPGLLTGRELLEDSPELPPQAISLDGLPLIELRAITQRETREKVAGVSDHRVVEAALRDQCTETANVQVDRLAVESDAVSLDLHLVATKAGSERRQRSAQRASGALGLGIRPKQSREAVAGLWLAGNRKVGDESHRFARIHLDRAPATLDARRSQEFQDQPPAGRPQSRGGLRAP